jgi:flagellar basal-body rod protein FlgB
MISALFNQTYDTAKAMLDVTALRHQAIASNLSNLETPNYKRIDISPTFETELKQAIDSGDPTRLQSLTPSLAIDQSVTATNRDGNSVVLEDELLAMNQNTLSHTLETQILTAELLKLRMAITGQV